MKPVEQTTFGGPDAPHDKMGNCMAACFASIFEIPLEDAPHVVMHKNWWDRLNRWLWERGFALEPTQAPPIGYSFIGVCSVRGDWVHTCVAYDGQLIWNPAPYRDEWNDTYEVVDYWQLIPLDPSRPGRSPSVPRRLEEYPRLVHRIPEPQRADTPTT